MIVYIHEDEALHKDVMIPVSGFLHTKNRYFINSNQKLDLKQIKHPKCLKFL